MEGDLWGNKTHTENQPEVEERGPVKSPDTTRDLLKQHTGRMQELGPVKSPDTTRDLLKQHTRRMQE